MVSSGCAPGNQVGDLRVSGFGLIELIHQTIVAFLVLSLIKGDMCVLFDAVLDELRCDIDFRFQLGQLTFKGCGVKTLCKDLLIYANAFSLGKMCSLCRLLSTTAIAVESRSSA